MEKGVFALMETIRKNLQSRFLRNEQQIYLSSESGYWSNLNKADNQALIESLANMDTRRAVCQHQPQLFDIIFSEKREAGLELLELSGHEACVDFGCMWGALTIGLAKRAGYCLGIDQTSNSLLFLQKRIREERLKNVDLLLADLKHLDGFDHQFDVAVVNGVLEWIPEEGHIELTSYYGKKTAKSYGDQPGLAQRNFLKMVHASLKSSGKIYLAIENRFDFKSFFGSPDPHTGLLFSSFLPRPLANVLSRVFLGRPYVNWLYSFSGLRSLLKDAGFLRVDLYMCFPDYRYPERIIPFSFSLDDFTPTISPRNSRGELSWKRCLARAAEGVLFRGLKARSLAPSIIAIGSLC